MNAVVPRVDWPACKNDGAEIVVFEIDDKTARWENLQMAFSGQGSRQVSAGTYRKLVTTHTDNGRTYRVLQMSDTPAEIRDHWRFVGNASGRLLVTGLGLGVVVNALLLKPSVDLVVVQEVNRDVIDLVAPLLYAKHGTERLVVLHEDALVYKPKPDERYDYIWHDIWPDISTDNKPQYTQLKRKWARRVPAGNQDAWANWYVYRRERGYWY